jgi:hypothetical protein
MRLNDNTRFSHPVLKDDTDDYVDGFFAIDVEYRESKATTEATISYTIQLEHDELTELINQGKAAYYLNIFCTRTYFDKMIPLDEGGGNLEYFNGEFNGRVGFRPMICATSKIDHYTSDKLHEEYRESEWVFNQGDILALGHEAYAEFGLAKLQAMETIFDLAVDKEIPEGETRVFMEKERIEIATGPKTNKKIHGLRNMGSLATSCLLNGVYLPVVMDVLSCLSKDPVNYEGYNWFNIFTAKCAELGISLENPNLLTDAQALLKLPLNSLLDIKEFR